MKNVRVKQGMVEIPGKPTEHFDTIKLIRKCLDNPPPDIGFSMEDFRKRARIDKVLTAAKTDSEVLKFEDADFEELKKCVGQMRWGIRAPFVVDFVESFYSDNSSL